MRPFLQVLSVGVSTLLVAPLSAQFFSATALSSIDTFTNAPQGAMASAQTPAGPLAMNHFQTSVTVDAAGAPIASSLVRLFPAGAGYRVITNASVTTSQSPSIAVAGPTDVQVDIFFAVPSDATLVFRSPVTTLTGAGVVSLTADVGNDGSIDYTMTPGAPDAFVELPAGITSATVRLTTLAFATAGSSASLIFTLDVVPTERCTVLEVAPNCAPGSSFHALPRFDGGVDLQFIGDYFGTPPLVVLGVMNSPVPLPITGTFGFCTLVPSIDIVLPMTSSGFFTADFTIPRFDSPIAPLPFSFFVQALNLDPGFTVANTSRALMLTCP